VGHPSSLTVEEVATLASRLGWSFDALMAMTTPERRLWLAASERVLAGEAARRPPVPMAAAAPAAATAAAPPSRVSTEAERRDRLVQIVEEMAARRMR
jgi:hypothetical protein